jgi:hypothetical protein
MQKARRETNKQANHLGCSRRLAPSSNRPQQNAKGEARGGVGLNSTAQIRLYGLPIVPDAPTKRNEPVFGVAGSIYVY